MGGCLIIVLEIILCEDKNSSFYYFVSYNEEFVWTFSLAPGKKYLRPLGFLKYLYYTYLYHRRLLRFSRVEAGHQKYAWANHIAYLINKSYLDSEALVKNSGQLRCHVWQDS